MGVRRGRGRDLHARDGVLSLGDGKPADCCVKSGWTVIRVELDKEDPPYGFFVFERG